MDLSRWRIHSIRSVDNFVDENEDAGAALKYAYESLPKPPITSHAPLAAAAAAWPAPDGVDRISSLPDQILRNIVSRLPAQDAVHTGALASRWRGLWRSVPLVFLDAGLIPGCAKNPTWRPPYEDTLGINNAVYAIFKTHPGPFRCVQITCCHLDLNRGNIKRWMRQVANKGVQELAFINRPWPLNLPLPATLFSCTSLTRLHIGAWRFPDVAEFPESAGFPHLKELFLTLITMKDGDLAFLLDKSPVLEVLTIIASQQTDVHLCLVSHSLRCLQLGLSSLGVIAVADAPRVERLLLWMTQRRRTGGNNVSRTKARPGPRHGHGAQGGVRVPSHPARHRRRVVHSGAERRRRPHQPPPRPDPAEHRLPPPRPGRRAHRRARLALAQPLALRPLVFLDAGLIPGGAKNPTWRPGLEETLGITNAVSDALKKHPGPFRCVQITCCYLDMNKEKIKEWMQQVAAKGVQELSFINRPWPLNLPLPATLFSCTSLTRLHIGVWKSPVLEVLTIIASQTDVRLCLISNSLRCLQLGMSTVGDIVVAYAPRLERLLLWKTQRRRTGDNKFSRIKIGKAPNLNMLGYWHPGQHQLQIGDTIIEAGTKVSPSTIIPSVKILALDVHFEICNEVKTVPAFIKCFPNIEALHIKVILVNLACFIWRFALHHCHR
ncbi:hypothetical protein PR202_gb17003 [Eleusine coracana subsp. coracana]|uniref:F-box domain-containing protein n=1 Tax=Eleusine coracana subsp. coracana TaxID=191504 RepID=A0AAV5F1T5_ELECO|nr:hypothetical protein PR202_gb17003 [Eleusine coracana subsp. coracana]